MSQIVFLSKKPLPHGLKGGHIMPDLAHKPPIPGHPIKTCTLRELMEMQLPHRRHLVIPWLRQGESSMIFAAPGVGKSLFALDIALSVAGGGKALGVWQTGAGDSKTEGGQREKAPEATRDSNAETAPCGWKVLYVDGEMPLDDIRDRANMLMQGKIQQEDGFDREQAGQNLHFMARHQQDDILADFVDLADADSRRNLLARIQRERIDLVILDNLSTLAAFEDENAASSFNGPVDFLQRLKSIGTACILVHHTNKGGEEFRGSSRIATTFETLALLKAAAAPPFIEDGQEDDGESDSSASAFTLEWRKYRGRRDTSIQDKAIFILSVDTQGNAARWHVMDTESGMMLAMLEMVRSKQCPTQRELAEALGTSPATLSRMKQKAMKEGRITKKEWDALLKAAGQSNAPQETEF
ncbi:AAA family ATPase [Desulfovibrio piger]|uniref:AAA family ATPase n=1 Tax=Desulfovibrio piger TaxID=901 RepID=UPI0039F64060